MRSTYLIAGAIVLALVAAGVLFGTDFFRNNPFASAESQLLISMNDATTGGGYAATFAEPGAKAWTLGPGHRLERFSLNSNEAVFARLTSGVPADLKSVNWPALGLTWQIPLEFNNRSNGRHIEVGVVARQATTNSSDSVHILYATNQAGNSGWRKFNLGPDFQLIKFQFQVPELPPNGYVHPSTLVINADPAGHGKAVELLGAYVKPVP